MNRLNSLAACFCLAIAVLQSHAAYGVPSVHEGVVKSILDNKNGSLTITCGETPLIINATTIVQSPVRILTVAEVLDQTPFTAAGFNPLTGAKRAGFVGGHCLATADTVTAPNLTAIKVMIDLGESTAVGLIISKAPFAIDKTPIVTVPEYRLGTAKPAPGFYSASGVHPAGAATTWPNAWTETFMSNEGFGINPATVLVGALASATGYNGSDGQIHGYDIVTDGQLNRIDKRVSISRAQCKINGKGKDQIDVQGGCVLGTTTAAAVSVSFLTAGQKLSSSSIWTSAGVSPVCTAAAPLVPTPGTNVGRYKFSNQALNLNGSCPSTIRVTSDNVKYDFTTAIR